MDLDALKVAADALVTEARKQLTENSGLLNPTEKTNLENRILRLQELSAGSNADSLNSEINTFNETFHGFLQKIIQAQGL